MISIVEKPNKKFPGKTSLFISFSRYNPIYPELLKSLPDYDFNKETKEWEISILQLANVINLLCIYDDIEIKCFNFKEELPTDYELLNHKTQMFSYQEDGVKFGLNHDKWLLLDQPGLGKSLQIIYLAEELKARYNIEHCLIICGVNTLKTNWRKEIQKHSTLSCKILGEKIGKRTGKLKFGSIKDRINQLNKKIDEFFVITNVETLRNDEIIKLINNGPNNFDMIAFDEIHVAKSNQSQQGKNMLKLNKAKYQVGATGTLLLNDPLDVYMPLKWIGAEKKSFSAFKYFYCEYGGPFNNIIIGFKNLKILKQQLEEVSLRRKRDLLDLPPITIIPELVAMESDQETFYENIKAGVKEEADKIKLNTASILALTNRLRQATACPSILTTQNISSAKLDRCCDLVEQITSNGDKVVIFSTFKETVRELEVRLQKYNYSINTGDIDDAIISANVDKFQQDPKEQLFIATWQKCGTGITLTASSYMIFLDTPWTMGVFEQACDRIYRIGTARPVTIYNLITNNTIDEHVFEILEDKDAISSYIIDDDLTEFTVNRLRKFIQDL